MQKDKEQQLLREILVFFVFVSENVSGFVCVFVSGTGDISHLVQFQRKPIDLDDDTGRPDPAVPTPSGPGYPIEGIKNSENRTENLRKLSLESARRAFGHIQHFEPPTTPKINLCGNGATPTTSKINLAGNFTPATTSSSTATTTKSGPSFVGCSFYFGNSVCCGC